MKVIKEEKTCKSCKVTKPLNNFTIIKGTKEGVIYRFSKCKTCVNNKYTKIDKATCKICHKQKGLRYYDKATQTCSQCIKKAEKLEKSRLATIERKKNKRHGTLTEQVQQLKREAKVLAKGNVKDEAWKLNNGWSWVTEEVPFTKYTTKKQRVLRKVKR